MRAEEDLEHLEKVLCCQNRVKWTTTWFGMCGAQHKYDTFSEAVGEADPAATTDCTASLAAWVAAFEAACTASGMPSMAGTAQLGIMPGCSVLPLSLSSMLCETAIHT